MQPNVSVIIVHYKANESFFQCLKSIYQSKNKTRIEIIVVDNDEKKSIEKQLKTEFPQVVYIASKTNKGFSAGCNLGAQHAKGAFFFFLNPDTIIYDKTIDFLVEEMRRRKKFAIIAPLLTDTAGNVYPLQGSKKLTLLRAFIIESYINKYYPSNPVSESYFLKKWNKKSFSEVDVVPGTAFMIVASIFRKVAGFDEHFFLFFEEHDLCNRVKQKGYLIGMLPESKVTHIWGESTKTRNDIQDIFERSRRYYFKKYYGFAERLLMIFLILTSRRTFMRTT